MLTRKRVGHLTYAGLMGATLSAGLALGPGAIVMHGAIFQDNQSQRAAQSFAGTWNWLFNGRTFSTMTLIENGDSYSGTVTPSRIALEDDGRLDMADPVPNARPSEISEARVTNSVLHVKTKDGFTFSATLTDSTHAAILPGSAPSNMKPIVAQKVQ